MIKPATLIPRLIVLFVLVLSMTILPAETLAQNLIARDEILVRFKKGTVKIDKSIVHAQANGTPLKEFKIVEGLQLVKIPPWMDVETAIQQYLQHRGVLYAEPNYIVKTSVAPNDPSFSSLWGLHNTGQSGGTSDADIDVPEAWDITTGSGNVVVAVIDTGIDDNHQDLSANMFQNSDDCNTNGLDDEGNGFVDDCHGLDKVNDDSDPMDDEGHGTHVAGTIGAVGNNNLGLVGVNWDTQLMACKFLDSSGSGFTSDAISCMEYVKLMKDRGVNIVATNNSWGGGGFSQALMDSIDAHLQRGILFVAAAGNDGTDNDDIPQYPCNYYLPNVICVASTTRTDARSSFSNFGRRTVHLGAPGSSILSTIPGNAYAIFSGTSMATPHVAGVVALLKAQDTSRDWKTIKNLILAGGNDLSSLASTITQKRLNAHGAMTCSNSVVLSRLKPVSDAVSNALIGTPIDLAALHINCAQPNGDVVVTVSPGDETITLLDDGVVPDQAAGDGIYSADWIPSTAGTFTIAFPGGDNMTVQVSSDPLPSTTIEVTPGSRNFGNVIVGESEDRIFIVRNIGSGTLTGSASVGSRFSIVSGGNYSLASGDSQTVTVRFSPASAVTFIASINFTGGGGASKTVQGTGVTANFILTINKTGSSGGMVTSRAIGIDCGGDCQQAYSSGRPVTLTASGAPFAGWTGGGCSGLGPCTVTMDADKTVTATFAAPVAMASSLKDGEVNVSYDEVVISGGSPPYTIALKGSLPAGLSIDSSDGTLSGTPTQPGRRGVTMTVTDQLGTMLKKKYTLNIFKAVSISITSLKEGKVGKNYSKTLNAKGGKKPYTWSMVSGSLPTGMSLSSTGIITGSPTAAAVGNPSLTFQVEDALGGTQQKTLPLTIN